MREVSFHAPSSSPQKTLEINGFQALDFFADGSFYLLNAPGHSQAQICGLARTTASSSAGEHASFIFMGADCVHHAGEMRPSPYLPLPNDITTLSSDQGLGDEGMENEGKKRTEPWLVCKDEATHDVDQTRETIEKVQRFDASEDVLVVAAHDESLMGVLGLWPEGANEWREGGWKGRGMWMWREDFL